MLSHYRSVLHVYQEPTNWNYRLAMCSGLTLESLFLPVPGSSVLFYLSGSLNSFFSKALLFLMEWEEMELFCWITSPVFILRCSRSYLSLINGPEVSLSVFFLMPDVLSCSCFFVSSVQCHAWLCMFCLPWQLPSHPCTAPLHHHMQSSSADPCAWWRGRIVFGGFFVCFLPNVSFS